MDRRAFLFSTAWLAVAPAPDVFQGAAQMGASVAPPGPASDTPFDAWKAAFIEKAVARGLPRDQVLGALAGMIPDPHVVTLDQRQPEFSKPISGYINSTVSTGRIAEAQSRLAGIRPWLDPITDRYQVPAEILVSIWAVESGFGQTQGDDDVIRSYATLAAEGRRQQFAEDELIGALRILFSGEATRAQLKGSWAGAMGQTQFTPLDYLAYAVDGDGDGKRDIWGSAPDALASTANFLAKKGRWQPEQSAQIEVAVHAAGFDYSLVEGPAKTPGEWATLGVTPVDSRGVPDPDKAVAASLIMPMGLAGTGVLRLPQSHGDPGLQQLDVLRAGSGIAGRPHRRRRTSSAGVARSISRVSLDDRKAAQQALASLGYYSGEVDGLLGTGTRKSARLWQQSQHLPPDGYLSYALIQRLKAQTNAAAPGTPGAY